MCVALLLDLTFFSCSASLLSRFFFAVRRFQNIIFAYFGSLFVMTFLTALFFWWQSVSIDLELWWIGYDAQPFDLEDRIRNVAPGLRTYAEDLYNSGVNNIGWPIKAAFAIIVLVVPFVTIVSLTICLKRRFRRRDK